MLDFARNARRQMKEKVDRLVGPSADKVDASDFEAYPNLNADVKTGARPLSRRQFKKGGKVVAMEGKESKPHKGRKPRKSGGQASEKPTLIDSLINRDVRRANEKREGIKHVGAFKSGGATKSADHLDEREDRALVKKMVKEDALTGKCYGGRAGKKSGGRMSVSDGELEGTRPTGGRLARKDGGKNWIKDAIKHPGALHRELHVPEGKEIPAKKLEKAEHSDNPKLAKRARLAETLKGFHHEGGRAERKSGGRAKGKTNINIVIDAGAAGGRRPMQPPVGAAPMGPNAQLSGTGGAMPIPVPMPQGMPAAAPAPMAAPMPAPMPRKRGGRTEYKMKDGAGGGEGRLQKIDWYGKK